MNNQIDIIRQQIIYHPSNIAMRKKGYKPLFTASTKSKIVIIGQAPGLRAQLSGIPWDDKSGQKLINWLGITEKQFRNPELISLMPMDFYYPGKGRSGDLPPRKDFATLWHKKLLEQMSDVKMIILVGQYAQKYYLGNKMKKNLTETVRNYTDYLPEYFPIVHPSPLNFRWQAKNRWFEEDLVPVLQEKISETVQIRI